MGTEGEKPKPNKGRKVRVDFRRNRNKRVRQRDWTKLAQESDDGDVESDGTESVAAKGDLSRRRTIIVPDGDSTADEALAQGVVVAMRGLYAEVDDGKRVVLCTVRRLLRTRLIDERNAVTVGDRVSFRVEGEGGDAEGVIEQVSPRHGRLRRRAGRRIHTLVANVDQSIIVSSADLPPPKPNLIDRYIVASLVEEIKPIICVNKADLVEDGSAEALVDRYNQLGHSALMTSVVDGRGLDELRAILTDSSSVITGQSGVGKSSLLNAIQHGLNLATGDINVQLGRGRHTTTTACLLRLDGGGYVVDTPGIRSFDLSVVPRHEIEACFVEFVEHIERCKFADCTHRHEVSCAVKDAVRDGLIHELRYASYVRIFEDLAGNA